jgi:hypothetical protein
MSVYYSIINSLAVINQEAVMPVNQRRSKRSEKGLLTPDNSVVAIIDSPMSCPTILASSYAYAAQFPSETEELVVMDAFSPA